MRFKPLSLALLGLIVTLVAAAAYLLRDSALYYPYVVVEVPERLQLTFLLKGRARESECESATATISNLLQTGCPTCRTKVRQCLGALTREEGRLVSDEALDTPSIRLPDGVVTYRSPDGKFALAACMESEKQSISTSSRLHCSPAGDMRPVPAERRATTLFGLQATSLAWLAIGVLALGSFVYLVQGRLPGLIAGLPGWPRRRKRLLILIVDVLSIELTLWLAFTLRLDSLYVPQGDVIILFALAPAIAVPIFVWFGLYRSIIRYLGVQAISSIAKATAIYIAILTFAVYMLGLEGTPRSTLLVHGVLALLAIAASRTAARTWINRSQASARDGMPRKNVVIYGAGSAGVQLATALAHSKELRPVAFLDDDARLHRNRVGELEVYPPNSLNELINRFDVQEVLLAVPSTSRHRRNEIIDLLELLPVQVRTLPGLSELAEGKIKTDDLREVDIEDLLGRDPVAPDPRLLRAIVAGKTVMVTGAGGSIGAELCRQIVVLRPKCLVLFEQSEFALYSIEMELLDRAGSLIPVFSPAAIVPLLGSVTDQIRIERVIGALRIETIFHAAAYKHVPMVEKNPCEGVFNNVFGTFRAAQAAVKHGVATFVLVSTDKAVRPTNTMGASKRFAEMILQAFAKETGAHRRDTRFAIVRFGNVLGSSGSVVPLFREQIRRGGPVTVTDPRIIRYFMTISEATQLVIQAGAMGTEGDVFVLDMGDPVKILDLAQRMIRLSGLQVKNVDHPLGDVEIVFSGLRPGEKLYEELLIGDDAVTTAHPRIKRANEKMLPMEAILGYLLRMEKILAEGDSDSIRSILLEAVEEFRPQCGNEDALRSSASLP